MDTAAYVKRMELAIVNANTAMEKLRSENKTLRDRVAELEQRLQEALESNGGVQSSASSSPFASNKLPAPSSLVANTSSKTPPPKSTSRAPKRAVEDKQVQLSCSSSVNRPLCSRPVDAFAKSIITKTLPSARTVTSVISKTPQQPPTTTTPVITAVGDNIAKSIDEKGRPNTSTTPEVTPSKGSTEEALEAALDEALNASDFSLSSDDSSTHYGGSDDASDAGEDFTVNSVQTSALPSEKFNQSSPVIPHHSTKSAAGWSKIKSNALSDILPQLSINNVHSAVKHLVSHPALDVSKEVMKHLRNQSITNCVKATQAQALISPSMDSLVSLFSSLLTSLAWNLSACYPTMRMAVLSALKKRLLHLMRYGAKAEPLPLARIFYGTHSISMTQAYSRKARVANVHSKVPGVPVEPAVDLLDELLNSHVSKLDEDTNPDDMFSSSSSNNSSESSSVSSDSDDDDDRSRHEVNNPLSIKQLPAGLIEAMTCFRVLAEVNFKSVRVTLSHYDAS